RDAVRLEFEGASAETMLAGEQRHPACYNFFYGNDPARWQTNVSAYSSVLYRGLYSGVDMRVREERERLEYDLLLAPEAALERVVVRCEGVTNISVAPDGALLLHTALGPLRQAPPKTWEVLPNGEKRSIECQFQRLDSQRYGFVAQKRDCNLAMLIDPGLEWGTYLGGCRSGEVRAAPRGRGWKGGGFCR